MRTAGLCGEPVPLVDAGTGNFGGDHGSFTGLYGGTGAGWPRYLKLYDKHYALTNELKA
jgi:hypothetical protein